MFRLFLRFKNIESFSKMISRTQRIYFEISIQIFLLIDSIFYTFGKQTLDIQKANACLYVYLYNKTSKFVYLS